jgi:ribosomal protein S18 acetylase RimI-like enzyme
MNSSLKVRPIRRKDRPRLAALLKAQRHFRPCEVQIALELIDIVLNPIGQEDYLISCAEDLHGDVRGYVCYGKAPLTDAVYDLYWIVVHPDSWNQGTGTALLRQVQEDLTRKRARLLLIETSSLPEYAGPRAFYQKHGYRELARIPDYYAVGDHKLILGKTFLPQNPPVPTRP